MFKVQFSLFFVSKKNYEEKMFYNRKQLSKILFQLIKIMHLAKLLKLVTLYRSNKQDF